SGYPSFGFAENTDDLFVGKTLLHGDVLMWLMKTLLTSGCTNQRGAGQLQLQTKGLLIYMIGALWSLHMKQHKSGFGRIMTEKPL
ncbi:hypothetical protein, partial [Enterobacter roggenkampii]|uniref:hypothetical protein n=1 Tax=Enterobacter roggenkampii TaxID=1812935 RepID=UPI000A0EE62C